MENKIGYEIQYDKVELLRSINLRSGEIVEKLHFQMDSVVLFLVETLLDFKEISADSIANVTYLGVFGVFFNI